MRELSDAELVFLSLRFDLSDRATVSCFTDIVQLPFDWVQYQKRFIDERLEGYFLYNLKRVQLERCIPESVRFSFSSIAAETVARNVSLTRSFGIVADCLNGAKIPFLCLKGAHLLGSVYRDYPLRRMSDIDVLIHPETLSAVERILCKEGFAVSAHDNPSVRHSRILAPVLREIMFERRDCKLDVHWGLAKPDGIAMMQEQRLWDKTGALDLEGRVVSVLSAENLFLHLSTHLFKNIMRKKMQLVMFCDIIDVIRYYADTFDWDYVCQAVREERLEPAVYSLLTCVHKEGFCTLPSSVQNAISPYRPFMIRQDGRCAHAAASSEGAYYCGLLKGISGVRNKVFFLTSILFPTKKWLRIYHPGVRITSTALLYLYHWKVSLGKGIQGMKEFFR